jgi:hypothetical protein
LSFPAERALIDLPTLLPAERALIVPPQALPALGARLIALRRLANFAPVTLHAL